MAKEFLDHTFFDASPYRARASRPSARIEVAAQLFLDRAATPPLLRRGVVTPTFEESPQFGQLFLDRRGGCGKKNNLEASDVPQELNPNAGFASLKVPLTVAPLRTF